MKLTQQPDRDEFNLKKKKENLLTLQHSMKLKFPIGSNMSHFRGTNSMIFRNNSVTVFQKRLKARIFL